MRGAPFVLFVVAAASVARMVLQHGMGNMAVRDELDRAVVVAQLLFGQHVRTVTVHAAECIVPSAAVICRITDVEPTAAAVAVTE